MENFIKFVPGTPFQGTLPGELVKKLGSPAPEVGMAALSFFARSSNSQLCCCSPIVHRITISFIIQTLLNVKGDAVKNYTRKTGLIQNYSRQTGTYDHPSYYQFNIQTFKINETHLQLSILCGL